MRKNIENHEEELISLIANNRISYEDCRSEYFYGESSRFRLVYKNLYGHGLITEDWERMKLTKASRDVYFYKDFKKHPIQSKIGMKDQNESPVKTRNHLLKFILRSYY